MTDAGTVRLERLGNVAMVTFDRPAKLNAFTQAMDREMNDIAFELNNDNEIRSVVLTGAGGRAFCAGSDLTDLEGYGDNWTYRNRFDAGKDYARAVWRIRKPVVAAIDGYAIGGGLEVACGSDIRIATPASSFGAGEINWGWHGGSGATQLITRAVGPGHAAKLLLTGQRIDAAEALRIGLVQELVDGPGMLPRALELASIIGSKSPIAAQSAKNLIRVAQSASVEVGLAYENDMFSYCMTTEDAAEGQRAFAEGRDPEFKGR